MVFISKKKKAEKDLKISRFMGRNPVKGDVGIEIEVEGRKIPKTAPAPWAYHADGSLRGAENGEYVFSSPQKFADVDAAIDTLWEQFKENGTVLDESNRTSVHVHLNISDFYLNRLTSLMALWFTFEDVLVNWCGEYRTGNLFCLRAKDSPNIITTIRNFIRTNMQSSIRDNQHYAAMNTHAIIKFQSLEFRPMRGVQDPELIKTWVRILKKMYDASALYEDPRKLCEQFSLEGPRAFFEFIFGDQVGEIRKGVDWSEEQLTDNLYEGIRFAQDLCYARDWDDFNPIEAKKDPFGREYIPGEPAVEAPAPRRDHNFAAWDEAVLNAAQFAPRRVIRGGEVINTPAGRRNPDPFFVEPDWI